ncbi:SDR family NAD(P)-dependent oxidoreductase [bacterium]|nr:SDR family NAD(P)-dependent oxidoreductase [bacterium]
MKFVVTGGAGFIGSHLAKFLVKNNHEVLIIDNLIRGTLNNIDEIKDDVEFHKVDISNYSEIDAVVDSADGIFHEAALASVPQSFKEPERYQEVNAIGSENIFKLGEKHNAKIVFASTSSVYGDQTKFPVNENAQTNPLNPYGQSKLEAEKFASKYAAKGLRVIGLRYFNVFGIGQNPEYAGVIPKFIDRISQNKPPIIEGDGNNIRSFTFVDDVVQANILAFKSNVNHEFINIASEDMTSINELAEKMIKMSGLNLKPIYDEPRKGDIKKSNADISKAKELLKWNTKITLEEGLKKIFPKK